MSLGWAEAAEPASQPTSIPVSSQYNSADSQAAALCLCGLPNGWLAESSPAQPKAVQLCPITAN